MIHPTRPPDIKECVIEKYFPNFLTKAYDVGSQKNRLNETVILSAHMCLNGCGRK